CLEHTFGPDCSLTCDDCQNGATCTAEGSGCHCPPGWTGVLCNQCCDQKSTSHMSAAMTATGNTKGHTFPSATSALIPVLCSLSAHALACPEGLWGSGCQEICPDCANNASCDPATGACLCPPGYTGQRC
ncbi:hypothetical protein Nmel_015812, partial [Mimus melanotis]